MTKAVILAAGSASRMQENIERYIDNGEELAAVRKGEKMAARFSRYPFLDYQVLNLVKAGIEQINVVVRPDDVFFTGHYGSKGRAVFPEAEISFSFQKTPDGTAHAVLAAEEFVARDRFVALNGDNNYPQAHVEALARSPDGDSSLVAFDTRGFSESNRNKLKSFALLRTAEGYLQEIVEKPGSTRKYVTTDTLYGPDGRRVRVDGAVLVSMNLWCFDPEIMGACRDVPRHEPRRPGKDGEFELPDAVKLLIERGNRFLVYYAREDVLDLTNAEDIETVAGEVAKNLADKVAELARRYAGA